MQFTVQRTALERELSFLTPVLPKWSLKPEPGTVSTGAPANGLSISVVEGEVLLHGANAHFSLSTTLPASNTEGGRTTIEAMALPGLVQLLDEDQITFRTRDDQRLQMSWTNGAATFLRSNREPAKFAVNECLPYYVEAKTLRDLLQRTNFAFPSEYSAKIPGVLFEFGSAFRVVALETAAMAVCEAGTWEHDQPAQCIVPVRTCDLLLRLTKDIKNQDVLLESSNKLRATCGGRVLVAAAAAGQYPPWQRMHITSPAIRADFPRALAAEAMGRIAWSDPTSPTDVVLRRGEMTLRDVESGTSDAVGLDYDGEPLSLRFRTSFLKGALNSCKAERVELIGTTPMSHFILRPKGGGSEFYAVSPIRIKD